MQFKNSRFPGFVYRGQRQQILLESILVERILGLTVPYGLIKFIPDGRIIRVGCVEQQKSGLVESLLSLRSMIESELMPEATDCPEKCVDCCFKRLCLRA